jgi:ring-1,2-phenylacetyl-CoA epoxidase subunit PaaD
MQILTTENIWEVLDEVKDPEIPVVSLVEMGIIRQVELAGETVIVTMTPTFSGCPALQVMKTDIEDRLRAAGISSVEVRQVLDPPWSSDWITAAARQKLKQFGLAPPPRHGGNLQEILLVDTVACPYCDSTNTTLKNSFGPTLCRAIHYCNDCQQPFEQFKPL